MQPWFEQMQLLFYLNPKYLEYKTCFSGSSSLGLSLLHCIKISVAVDDRQGPILLGQSFEVGE
jgi:hypothetical protein